MDTKQSLVLKFGASEFQIPRPSVLQFNIEKLISVRDAGHGFMLRYRDQEQQLKKSSDPSETDQLLDQMVDSINLASRASESLARRVRHWLEACKSESRVAVLLKWLSEQEAQQQENLLLEAFNQAATQLLGSGDTVKN